MGVVNVFGVRRLCGTRVRKFAVPIGVQLCCGTRLRNSAARRFRKFALRQLLKIADVFIEAIILVKFLRSLPSLSSSNKVEGLLSWSQVEDIASSKPPLPFFDEFQSLEPSARTIKLIARKLRLLHPPIPDIGNPIAFHAGDRDACVPNPM